MLSGCDSDPVRTGSADASAQSTRATSNDGQAVRVTAIKSAPSARQNQSSGAAPSRAAQPSAADEASTEPTLLVTGRVTTAQGRPAGDVTVALMGVSRDQMGSMKLQFKPLVESVTNARGEYELRGPNLDFVYMTATGSAPAMQIQFDRNAINTGTAPRPGLTRIRKDIQLLDGHGVSGVVVDEAGRPLAGVPVHLLPQYSQNDQRLMDTTKTTTTAEGTFHLDNVATGGWMIGADHPDYAPIIETISVPTTGPVTLTLSVRGGTLTGHVINKTTGEPAAGVGLMFGPHQVGRIQTISTLDTPMTTSTADGSFRFEHVRPGMRTINLVPNPETKLGILSPFPGRIQIDDQQTTDVTVYVYSGHTVTGRVYDKDTGEALPGTKVTGSGAEAIADADGNYRLTNVLSNLYAGDTKTLRLSAEIDGYAVESDGTGNPGSQQALVKLPADTLEVTKDLPLVKKLVVRGIVVTRDGKPIPHARVALYNNRSFTRDPEKAAVSEDGTFELETLPFVTNIIEAEATGYGAALSEEVEVAAEDVEGVKITMEPGATIDGRVLGPNRQPVAGAKVSQNKQYGNSSFWREVAISGEDGIYRISDAPKKVSLLAGMAGFADSEALELSLAAGEVRSEADLHLRAAFSISGRVIDTTGKPVSGEHVNANGGKWSHGSANTDGQGKFEFKDLPDGTYNVSIYSPIQKTVEGVKAGTKDLEIVVGEPEQSRGTNQLIGTVVDDATSKPIEKFEIEAYQQQITKLREPGQFLMTGIPDWFGYSLSISSPGYETQKFTTKSGSGGETIRQEFRLGTGGAIIGRVVESGTMKPMPGLTVINWGKVRGYDRERMAPKSHTITDDKGGFVLAPAPSGENTVEVKAKEPYSTAAKTAVVISEQTTDMGDIEITRGGTITVHVVRAADDQPASGEYVRLSAWSQEMQVGKSGTADASGAVKFEGLTPMNYSVYAGSVNRSVKLEAEETAEVTLRLGTVTIKGTVTRGGAPVDASVEASSPDGGSISSSTRAGSYTINNVVPGTYKFNVYPHGGGSANRHHVETVEVPDQTEFTKDFELPAAVEE